jgi:PleD family two-component response regulator
MRTVIANDRIGRFAELDHEVLEEVQVIMEADDNTASVSAVETGVADCAARPLDWLRAALRATVRSSSSS